MGMQGRPRLHAALGRGRIEARAAAACPRRGCGVSTPPLGVAELKRRQHVARPRDRVPVSTPPLGVAELKPGCREIGLIREWPSLHAALGRGRIEANGLDSLLTYKISVSTPPLGVAELKRAP